MDKLAIDESFRYKYTKNENYQYHSFNDNPAIEFLDDSIKIWYNKALIRRVNNPAIIRKRVDGRIINEYYYERKLHSPNANSPAISPDQFYYFGEKLVRLPSIDLSNSEKMSINVCSLCNIFTPLMNGNADDTRIYCQTCNKMTIIRTEVFEKILNDQELVDMIKEYSISKGYNDKNKYFEINQLKIENIKIHDSMSEYYKKMYDDHMTSLSGQVIKFNNKYYDQRLFNKNKIFDNSTLLNLDNIFIDKGIIGQNLNEYICNSNLIESFFEDNARFAINLDGTRVICDLCNEIHDSSYIIKASKSHVCKYCKKNFYLREMVYYTDQNNNISSKICKTCDKRNNGKP
jgi:hypothetical protein